MPAIFPVGGKTELVSATPVLTVAATYVANDYVGTSATPITFTNAVLDAGGTGVIVSAVLVDYALQSVACELWLFDTAITPPDDSAPWTLSDAHAARLLGVIPFSTYYASALNSVSVVNPVAMSIKALSGSRNIYGCIVTRGAPAYASLDLTIRLMIIQD
jgi:hypothetical protein